MDKTYIIERPHYAEHSRSYQWNPQSPLASQLPRKKSLSFVSDPGPIRVGLSGLDIIYAEFRLSLRIYN